MNRKKLLVVVDMQNDFIDGPLGSKAAVAIVDKVCRKISEWDGYVAFTMDTHYEDEYLNTVEGKHIPTEHCINETNGWRLNADVEKYHTDQTFTIYKDAFGSTELANVVRFLEIEEVELIGVCTDICVVSNAIMIRSAVPDVRVTVDASCCAGTTPENHSAALAIMKQCCVDIMNA